MRQNFIIARAALAGLAIVGSLAASSQSPKVNAAALREAAQRFVTARLAEVGKGEAADCRVEGPSLGALEIGRTRTQGSEATLRADLRLDTGEGVRSAQWDLRLQREGRTWKVTECRPTVQVLADALVAEENAKDPAAVLAREEASWSSALEEALVARAEERENARDIPGASRIYEVILNLAEKAGDDRATAEALRDIGYWAAEEGDYKAAVDYQTRALAIAKELGDALGQLKSHNNLGVAYSTLGNLRESLNHYRQALPLAGNTRFEVALLTNVGSLLGEQGDYAAARSVLEGALERAEKTEDPYDAGEPLNNLGFVYTQLGDFKKAQECFEKFLKIAEAAGASNRVALALNNVGNTLADLGRYPEALEYLDRSLKLAESIDDRTDVLLNVKDLSRVALLSGQPEKALGHGTRCTALAREHQSPALVWQCRSLEGRAQQAMGRKAPAREAFLEAIEIAEVLRTDVAGGEEQRVRFFAEYVAPYQGMVQLLVDEGRSMEALGYAERAKGRVLLEVLRQGRADLERAMTPAEREEEKRLAGALASLNREAYSTGVDGDAVSGRGTERALVDARLEKARREYETFRLTLYASHPELRVERGELDLPTAEAIRGLLAPDDALLEYVVSAQAVNLFVMTRGEGAAPPRLEVVRLEGNEASLRKDVASFRRELAERSLGYRQAARRLYARLLKPAEARLVRRRALVVVPDGPLWDLPFQALMKDGRHLLEDFAISYAPSLSVLAEMTRRPRPTGGRTRLLAMGDPDLRRRGPGLVALPEGAREVLSLGTIYGLAGCRIYTGGEAREDTWKREAPRASVLHLASHGILDDRSPMYSHILLAGGGEKEGDDGLLEAREIADMDLGAELAVLSACDSGRGDIGNGEGVIGMSWAFFVAGCPATVVSHWKVDSASTTELMLAFHGALASRPGLSKAEALREAALKLLRKEGSRHPFYWAGFSLVGSRAPLSAN